MRSSVLRRAAAALLGAAAAVAVTVPSASADSSPAPSWPSPPAYLNAGQQLPSGQSLTQGDVRLAVQADGNVVIYLVRPDGQNGVPLWSTGTWGNPGAYLLMQSDGNLVLYRQGAPALNTALWSTSTWGHPGSHLTLDGGSFGLTDGQGYPLWSAQTPFVQAVTANNVGLDQPGSVLAPTYGMMSGAWMESGSVWFCMQHDGNLVVYRKRDGAALWSTGTWGNPGAYAVVEQGTLRIIVPGRVSPTTPAWIWQSTQAYADGAYLKVQDDANVVVYQAGGAAIWSTGTWNQG